MTITMYVIKRADPAPSSRAPRPYCESCGALIGVYEPLVVDGPHGRWTTSLAAEPDLVTAVLACRHPACVVADAPRRG